MKSMGGPLRLDGDPERNVNLLPQAFPSAPSPAHWASSLSITIQACRKPLKSWSSRHNSFVGINFLTLMRVVLSPFPQVIIKIALVQVLRLSQTPSHWQSQNLVVRDYLPGWPWRWRKAGTRWPDLSLKTWTLWIGLQVQSNLAHPPWPPHTCPWPWPPDFIMISLWLQRCPVHCLAPSTHLLQ